MTKPAGLSADRLLSLDLSERMGVSYSDTFPRILEMILDAVEMELLLETPGVTEDIARSLGREESEVAEALYDLYMRGVVYVTDRANGAPVWGLIDAGRFMDCVLFDSRYDRFGDEFFELWRRFFNQEMVVHDPPHESLRVLPIEEVIRSTRILDIESAHSIVEGARRIAVQRCPCRTRERRCDNPLEVCLSLDGLADYVVSRDLGQDISKARALSILDRCEDLGLVHQTINSDQPDVICNCCPCCCSLLRSVVHHGVRAASAASRFRPVVDETLCVNCLDCTDACHFSAMVASDGQRSLVSDRCFGCGLCAHVCPQNAIALVEALPAGHIPSGPGFNPSYLPWKAS